jgi:hypothetical protein
VRNERGSGELADFQRPSDGSQKNRSKEKYRRRYAERSER